MTDRKYVLRNSEETLESARTAFKRLLHASSSYDDGFQFEAISLAALVHLFVHDHGRTSVSVLTQLGLKTSTRFQDTATLGPTNNMLAEVPLTITCLSVGPEEGHAEYKPKFDKMRAYDGLKEVVFSRWWEGVVILDHARRPFSRKNLITFFRNTLGGRAIQFCRSGLGVSGGRVT